jgi:hypothetical protein
MKPTETPADNDKRQQPLAPATCYALAVTMSKVTPNQVGYTTTTRQMIGYRRTNSRDEAIGSFLRHAFKECEGFTAGEVISIIVPPAEA